MKSAAAFEPLAGLTLDVAALSRRGLTFAVETDDLDEFPRCRLRVGDVSFVLEQGRHSPTPDRVDVWALGPATPDEQLVALIVALELGSDNIAHHWDGEGWKDGAPCTHEDAALETGS